MYLLNLRAIRIAQGWNTGAFCVHSPITEGSTEGSSEESKAASTFATSHSLTSATKAPLTGNHGSNHTSVSASDSFPKVCFAWIFYWLKNKVFSR